MKIIYSPQFAKSYKKIPNTVKLQAEVKEVIFRKDLFDPRLKTHKLKGKLANFYSFSISYHWRIVFHFENNDEIVFDTIGTHGIYK